MKLGLVTLSVEGAQIARYLADRLNDECMIYVHKSACLTEGERSFGRIFNLTGEIFGEFGGLIYIVPCGVVVRALEGHITDKRCDPAVVTVDVGGRHVVSLLGGHEAGANRLAVRVANELDAVPVISTTTEMLKTLVVGVGCRRGVSADLIIEAIEHALPLAGAGRDDIRLLASADIKRDEPGLFEAARRLGVPLRFIASDQIRLSGREFSHSEFVEKKVNLPAVAEPSALLAGSRTRLILGKTKKGPVTVAVARESCMWSE